jgi:trigger factor
LLASVRPDVTLGDYKHFNFGPEIDVIDDARVDQVVEELRDQNATLSPVEDRGAKDGDYAVIAFTGTKDGVPFEGGSAERMPLILGQERLIPGFESHLTGLRVGESTEFDITFPDDYGEPALAGQSAHFAVDIKELREKRGLSQADVEVLPDLGVMDSQVLGHLGGADDFLTRLLDPPEVVIVLGQPAQGGLWYRVGGHEGSPEANVILE